MHIEAPDHILALLNKFTQTFKDTLGENIVGVYLHGSLAMDCFNPKSSDIDLLVVVKDKLTLEVKQKLIDHAIALSDKAPPKGFEMSVVTADDAKNFTYPTPYELHFSNDWLKKYQAGLVDLMRNNTDPDLTAHFTLTKARGKCLYGKPIDEVFGSVPAKYYLDSILQDNEESMQKILVSHDEEEVEVPVYGVLNAGRVLAFVFDGLVTSKVEGGEWALKRVPPEFAPIVRAALGQYEDASLLSKASASVLKSFAKYVLNEVRSKSKASRP